jgi:hypothetical protein
VGYPVVWRDQTYTLGDLTVKVKAAFVRWAKHYLTAEGIENLGTRPDLLNTYLANIYAELWWADGTMSKPVHSALCSPDGGRMLNRLLFGDSVKALSDSDLDALVDEKEAEQRVADEKAKAAGCSAPYPPANDYMAAMRAIKDAADPKASASGGGLTAGTGSTATT